MTQDDVDRIAGRFALRQVRRAICAVDRTAWRRRWQHYLRSIIMRRTAERWREIDVLSPGAFCRRYWEQRLAELAAVQSSSELRDLLLAAGNEAIGGVRHGLIRRPLGA